MPDHQLDPTTPAEISLIADTEYPKIRPLFGMLETFQPMCTAVLEGIWPGKVWVDRLVDPRTVCLVTFLSGGGAAWCFLAGEPDNREFNTALNHAIFKDRAVGPEVGAFLFTCDPGGWGGQLGVVGAPREPVPMSRRHYVCRELAYDWRGSLPAGYVLRHMEPSLLEIQDLQIPDPVKTTLAQWSSIEDERLQDYGFLITHENQVVSWATVDFVCAGSGDLGFETLSDYRKRGLGTLVAAAALDHGLTHGLDAIHWTCAVDNPASVRTAEKLGLAFDREYTMFIFVSDEEDHLAQLAYSHLARGDYPTAIEHYEQLFALKAEVPVWAYFDTAQAYAALGQGEDALKYLRLAAKSGWSAVETTEQTEEFHFLHATPEWDTLLAQIRRNKKG